MPSCQHTEIKTEPFIERNFHHPANELLGMSHAELELTREEQLKVSASSPVGTAVEANIKFEQMALSAKGTSD